MTTAETITIVVSIVSLVIAVVSWSISHFVNKRILQIEETREKDRVLERNSGKIKVIACDEGAGTGMLLIYNEGPVDIRVIDIVLNGISIRAHECFDFNLDCIKIPSGDNFYSLPMNFDLSTNKKYLPPYDVVVKWITLNGDKQQQEVTINWVQS